MCKMAHFGNCDPETADQEYCIFHKPNKTEEEAKEFYRKFLERFEPRIEEIEVDGRKVKRFVFGKPVDARGFVFPEIPNEPIEYVDEEGNKWERRFLFKYAIFERSANFNEVTFEGTISFEKAVFKNGADFIRGIFLEDANFSGVIFHKDVQFAEANFKSACSFFGVTFKGRAKFISCIFWKSVDFWLAKFNDVAVFSMSEFKEHADFHQATFNSKANFRGCNFKGYTTFSFSEMRDTDFKYCKFEDIAQFWDTIFRGDVYFDNSRFEYVVSFKNMKQTPGIRFHKILSFSNCDFRQGVEFIESIGDEKEFKRMFNPEYPQSLQEVARVQRLSFEKEGKREEADKMFVYERRARRQWIKKKARDRLKKAWNTKAWRELPISMLVCLYAYVSTTIEMILGDEVAAYGAYWSNIILSSTFVIFSCAVVYTAWGHYIKGFPSNASLPVRFANALYYSLVTFTTLGYGDMHPTGWLKALSAIEALTGAVFMALIVAVIARKWMR